MGFLTIILIVVTILVIIGLGWQTFMQGIYKGAEKIFNSSPELRNLTRDGGQYLVNLTSNTSKNILDDILNK